MRRAWFAVTALLALVCALPARAEIRVPDGADVYKAECGSCHDAYPPQLLRRDDWWQILAGLDKHFGTNASLSKAERQAVGALLSRYGAESSDRGLTATELRLTSTPNFRHHHRRVPAAAWTDPEVKRPSNCGACHLGADEGVFDHDAKLPGQS